MRIAQHRGANVAAREGLREAHALPAILLGWYRPALGTVEVFSLAARTAPAADAASRAAGAALGGAGSLTTATRRPMA